MKARLCFVWTYWEGANVVGRHFLFTEHYLHEDGNSMTEPECDHHIEGAIPTLSTAARVSSLFQKGRLHRCATKGDSLRERIREHHGMPMATDVIFEVEKLEEYSPLPLPCRMDTFG